MRSRYTAFAVVVLSRMGFGATRNPAVTWGERNQQYQQLLLPSGLDDHGHDPRRQCGARRRVQALPPELRGEEGAKMGVRPHFARICK
jgi:hypothetical protein